MKSLLSMMILLPLFSQAQQNLVPNGDFEHFTSCPLPTDGQILLASPWGDTEAGSPDYYNACSPPHPNGWPISGVPENVTGYQYAHSGDGYAGIYTYGGILAPSVREYLQIQLAAQLQPNSYMVSFWASLADNFPYAVGSLGAYLSDTLIVRTDYSIVLEVEPSIQSASGLILSNKDIWYHITDTFTSRFGGEQYLLIGNFRTTVESDTLMVSTDMYTYSGSYYYIDDVSVVALDSVPSSVVEAEEITVFNVYPNPNEGEFFLNYTLNEGETGTIDVFSALGRQVFSKTLQEGEGTLTIHLGSIADGLYNIRVIVNGDVRLSSKLIVNNP